LIINRQQAIETLAKHKPELVKRFGITGLALFGSTVRNEAKPDRDIIVDFDSPATSKQYFGMQFYLEDLLATPVDLVAVKAMRPELRAFIENEVINV
jgi:hypothetical protein